MMYPRLVLARDLLKDDGVIFISIDDNEQDDLKKICDEVFGRHNFLTNFIWRRRTSSALSSDNWSIDHEYVLAYRKSPLGDLRGQDKTFTGYSNPDNDPRGPWKKDNLTVGMTATQRPNQAYDLVDPNTGKTYPYNPNRVWSYIPESMNQLIQENRILFPDDTSKRPMLKRFKSELKKSTDPLSSLLGEMVGLNSEATRALQKLMDGNYFNYAKPLSLLELLIRQVCTEPKDIVLDFFSGSATTAQALMQFNIKEALGCQYVMIQYPELIDCKSDAYKAGYTTICDLGEERIRRAGQKIKDEIEQENAQLKFGEDPKPLPDIGFRVLRIDSSNLRNERVSPQDINQQDLFSLIDNIKEDRTPEDLLFQVLPQFRIPYSASIVKAGMAGKTVFDVNDGQLLACFDTEIDDAVIREMAQEKPVYAVFRDSSLKDDAVAANLDEIFKTVSPDTVRRTI